MFQVVNSASLDYQLQYRIEFVVVLLLDHVLHLENMLHPLPFNQKLRY